MNDPEPPALPPARPPLAAVDRCAMTLPPIGPNLRGRADLLRVLQAGGGPLADATAPLLGFVVARTPPSSANAADTEADAHSEQPPGDPPQPPEPVFTDAELLDIPFWCPIAIEPLSVQAQPDPAPPDADQRQPPVATDDRPVWTHPPAEPAAFCPLLPWPALRRRLRPSLTRPLPGREPDLERAAERVARGRLLERLPCRPQRRFAPLLRIVYDRSERLVPYWTDQDLVSAELARLLPEAAVEWAVFHEGLSRPRLLNSEHEPWESPPPGSLVLVLGDLGSLGGPGNLRTWRDLGEILTAAGCQPVALVPCTGSRVPPELKRSWSVQSWEPPPPVGLQAPAPVDAAGSPPASGPASKSDQNQSEPADLAQQRAERVQRLLTLLSPAVRIEPGLLRALRRALADPNLEAGIESDLWQHPAIASTHSEAATIGPRARPALQAAFAVAPATEQQLALELIRRWRDEQHPEIWLEEVARAAPALRHPPLWLADDLNDARRLFSRIDTELGLAADAPGPVADWLRRVAGRARDGGDADGLWQNPDIGPILLRLDRAIYGHRADYQPPTPLDPASLPEPAKPIKTFSVAQRGAALIYRPPAWSDATDGSPVGQLRSANRLIREREVAPVWRPHRDPAFWADGASPGWAARWDWDAQGPWVEIELVGDGGPVVQRLRWIPSGRFWMGSPEDEPGRYADEGPRHQVTIAEGFWLFDTPCTQALWQAVMGQNPSRFQDLERPVERVSWADCQGFIERINARLPGLDLSLPSEAHWEYACRAGSETALYSGPMEIFGEHNAPALDPIAWYGGNSGVDYDLDEAENTTGELWKEMQYPTKGAGTRKVKGKAPNNWGLYDMLGNVWEWVADPWHENYQGAPADAKVWEVSDEAGSASGAETGGVHRVFRGGSWYGVARYCRCACRYHNAPGNRVNSLGFRCARVQVGEPGRPVQAAGWARGPAEPRTAVAGRGPDGPTRTVERPGFWNKVRKLFNRDGDYIR